ncbi:MAG TPA: XdhC family protein, partial [Thermoanaerobaculia bacterium]|nr:XdhC family protein [Thermoanaerobaculia bacterium]
RPGSGARIGDRLTFPFIEGVPAPAWAEAASHAAASIPAGGAAAVERLVEGERALVLVESILPPVHLLLVGAERDAPPLARLADELGWKVTVVEPREVERDASALPARAVRVLAAPRELAAAVELSPRTAAVLATHRYLDDLAYLEPLLAAPLGYLALLGPVRRRERLLEDLAKREPAAARAAAERLRGPAGLDLGGRSPHEVALAIVAEIQATLHAADARPLTTRASRDARPATP